jgi:hypothetical protein
MTNKLAIGLGLVSCVVLLSAVAARKAVGDAKPQAAKPKIQQTLDITRLSELTDESKIAKEAIIKPKIVADSLKAASAPGLNLVCNLYGYHDSGTGNYDVYQNCDLPPGFKLDWKYQQKSISCQGGGANSNVAPGDVPRGIHLVCDGGYYWAIHKPVLLSPVSFDDNGTVNQWRVIVPMYCGPGAPGQPGCNIKVYVYADSL